MSITVYTRTTCAPCKTLKYWLGQKHLDYDEKNIDDEANFLELRAQGFVSVPVTVIDGVPVVGPNFAKISELTNGA